MAENYAYEDYYTEFKQIHESAKTAYEVSSGKTVSSNLETNISNAIETVNGTLLNQPEDEVAVSFDEGITSLVEQLTTLQSFATSYESAEDAYTELKGECDALEKGDGNLKTLCNNKPSSTDTKYAIADTDPVEYNNSAFQRDLGLWQTKVTELKTNLSDIAENIRNYIKYLEEVDGCLPSDGAISTETPKPLPISTDRDLDEVVDYEDISSAEPYVLEGEELKEFLEDNNIPNADYIKVVKSTAIINGVEFPIYAVYDKDCDENTNKIFDEYIQRALYYEGKVDQDVLARIAAGGTSIVFEETYRCDGGSLGMGYFNGAAYCNSRNRNVVQFFDPNDVEYYAQSIVHETGHAYDFTLYYELTGETCKGISHITQEDIANGLITKEQADMLFEKDENGNYLTWDVIIQDEVNYFDSSHSDGCKMDWFSSEQAAREYFNNNCLGGELVGITQKGDKWVLEVKYDNTKDSSGVTVGGGSSVYNVHDYVGSRHEYFADSFQAYFIGDGVGEDGMSRLEFLCPETFETLDTLTQNEGS